MNYTKPEVVKLESAIAAVRGETKEPLPMVDELSQHTISAYESDE
jgi:hypothetical protein